MTSLVKLPCILICLACANELIAQDTSALRPSPLSVELSIGPAYSRGSGEYLEESESALWGNLLAAVRVRSFAGGFLLGALNAGTRITPRVVTDICRLDADGDCIPHFPTFGIVGLGLGWENALATQRILTGPALVDSDGAESSFGWHVRFDLAGILTRRVALVAGARATFVPNHRGDTFGILGAGLGFRIR